MYHKHPTTTKFAVVGPESTGKSTVSMQLAAAFDTVCVPEYARYYCQNLDKQYTLQDEVNMYYGQIALEEALLPLAQHGLLIADTTVMTIKVWSDRLFGHTPDAIVQGIDQRHYDHYLLMDIDLPWEDDALRDFPHERAHFLEVWKTELSRIGASYTLISGQGNQRWQNALRAARHFLHQKG